MASVIKTAAGLPAGASQALARYLKLLDNAMPGVAHGVYLTGSAALGDWIPGRSDLDILTVTKRPLRAVALDTLRDMHARSPGKPYLDAVYVHLDEVGKDGDAPRAVDGMFRPVGGTDPVLWATLDRHGVTVRGPAAGALGAAPDPGQLRTWNLGNLSSYWRQWAANARTLLAGREADAPVPAYNVAWAGTGPGRLHATITSGEIISKTAAADYTARLLPRYAPLLARAKAWRLGDDSVTFTTEDGREACDLVDAVIDRAPG